MTGAHPHGPLTGRVFVVDDDVDILSFIRGALEDAGLTVMTARDGGQAVDAAAHFDPDMMIIDVIGLPGAQWPWGIRADAQAPR